MFHHLTPHRVLGASLVMALAIAPRPAEAMATVQVNNLSYEADRHSVVLAISGPVTISTRSLRAPARLVVDVPSATLMSRNRELVIQDDLVKRVRLSQFKIFPPTVRVVIETAGDTEPIIAVQQTGKNLYITVARPQDEREDDGHGHDHQHAPAPSPMATPSPIAPSPIVTGTPRLAPTPIVPSVRPTPSLRPSPSPSPRLSPTPAPSPVALPSPVLRATPTPLPTPRRGEQGGESGNESLPGMDE